MKTKFICMLPFLVLFSIVFYCWYQLLAYDYIPMRMHILALVLVIANAGVYFWNFKGGLAFTGVILLLASFSLIAINVELVENAFYFRAGNLGITFPSINFLSLFLLFFYCIINYQMLKMFFKRIFKLF